MVHKYYKERSDLELTPTRFRLTKYYTGPAYPLVRINVNKYVFK